MADRDEHPTPTPPLAQTMVSERVSAPAAAGNPGEFPGLRFQAQGLVAQGGMASIVHAYDPLLERHLALKTLLPALSGQPVELESFLREARVTAQLDHPNIVPVYDLAADSGGERACFAMKLVHGQSLAQRLRSLGERRLSPEELPGLIDVLIKVCDAVAFAHSRRVLHLDLKPDNVMIGSHGQVYVMDWGIAVRCERDEPSGRLRPSAAQRTVRGTLAYMPCEQLETGLLNVDERSDIYALGAMLYELLTGRPPFEPRGGAEDLERLRQHTIADPLALPAPHAAPAALCRTAMRALARDPEQRHESAGDFRAELEDFVRSGGWLGARRCEPGEVLMREGETAGEAYILLEGECDVFKATAGGQTHLRRMGPGEVFGEIAILTQRPRSATVIAATRATVLVITRETLERELAGKHWMGLLIRALADRFRDADEERTRLRGELSRV
jgi:eukaryotic-like serine/threonine-protein kinase